MRSSTLTPEDVEKILNDPGPKVVLRRCDTSTEERSPTRKRRYENKSASSGMVSASKSSELNIAVSKPLSPFSLVHNSKNDAFNRKTKERLGMQSKLRKPTFNDKEWLGIILWDSKVLKKMKMNEASNFERYTQQGLGKMLSKSVIKCNKNFNHKEPYLLVDVVEKEIYANPGFLKIRVAETTFFKNMDTPVNERTFDLLFPVYMAELAEEIVRLPLVPTTLMIWNCEVWPLKGNLERASINCIYGRQPRILIFHHEAIHPNRRRLIQNKIRTSELKSLFESGKIQKCFTFFHQYPDNEESISVHIKPKDSSSKPIHLVPPNAVQPEDKSNEEGSQHPHVLAQSNDVDFPSSQIMDFSDNPDNYQFTALLNDLV